MGVALCLVRRSYTNSGSIAKTITPLRDSLVAPTRSLTGCASKNRMADHISCLASVWAGCLDSIEIQWNRTFGSALSAGASYLGEFGGPV